MTGTASTEAEEFMDIYNLMLSKYLQILIFLEKI